MTKYPTTHTYTHRVDWWVPSLYSISCSLVFDTHKTKRDHISTFCFMLSIFIYIKEDIKQTNGFPSSSVVNKIALKGSHLMLSSKTVHEHCMNTAWEKGKLGSALPLLVFQRTPQFLWWVVILQFWPNTKRPQHCANFMLCGRKKWYNLADNAY